MSAVPATAFSDLPASAFPFTVEFIRARDGRVMHRVEVAQPGALTVPSNDELGGERIAVRITYADGTVEGSA